MKLNPYLNYGGNCAEAFRFYEKHLGGATQGLKPSAVVFARPAKPPLPSLVVHGISATQGVGKRAQSVMVPLRRVNREGD